MSLRDRLLSLVGDIGADIKGIRAGVEYGTAVYGTVPLGGYPLARSAANEGTLRRVYVETDAPLTLELHHNDVAVWSGVVDGQLEEAVNVPMTERDQLTLHVLSGTATQMWFQTDGVTP